ncbi:UNVERIFIED_CONTAM: Pectinesterase 2.1 [Sesamum angustifolium]|uniref:Pectinesterase n=1 Tax=Sesamum angustifolium TaxID=2727405 RepID=A0AAW2PBV5_9LAMI
MASTHQPLLNTPNKNTSACKILFFAVSVFALLISAAFLLPNITKNINLKGQSTPSFLCRTALNPRACQGFVSEVVSDGVTPPDATIVLQKFLIKQVHHLNGALFHTRKLKNQLNGQNNEHGALADCVELIDLSIDLVFDSIKALRNETSTSRADAQAWLSAVLDNHVTCFDGLNSFGRNSLGAILEDLISRARASLAMLAAVSEPEKEMVQSLRGKLPSWITAVDRKLLQSRANAIDADLVVAKDGSGKYKTVAEAIAAAPDKSKKRYVIYVKKGTYKENVEVGKNKKNLMIIGDGMDSTIITGDLNVVDGSTTFKSATLGNRSRGGIHATRHPHPEHGRPEKHQAVALRVGADKSVINRCRIDAYQDTLYAHSLRQFYRDSYITGTVDFIFGNAAVVFQKCKLVARKPMKSQKNMVTAQGRTDPNQNTGTSIQDCEIKASEDLEPEKSSFPTYLGRPWKEYSRTVVMQSNIGDHIDPAGWSEWSGDFALKTLYYGEYMNKGPGAGTSKRVKWGGYHVITNSAEAAKFTVKQLIQGGEWLGSTGVAYTEGL